MQKFFLFHSLIYFNLIVYFKKERLAAGNSSQCGFCTPGIVMSLYGLLKIKQEPTVHDIEDAFDGNLCRCTGYRPILESARTFAKKECSQNKSNSHSCSSSSSSSCSSYESKLVDFSHFKAYDPNADVPFPSGLMQTESQQSKLVVLTGANSFWIKPSSLDELLDVKHLFPSVKLVGGNSEIGVEMKFKNMDIGQLLYVTTLRSGIVNSYLPITVQ